MSKETKEVVVSIKDGCVYFDNVPEEVRLIVKDYDQQEIDYEIVNNGRVYKSDSEGVYEERIIEN